LSGDGSDFSDFIIDNRNSSEKAKIGYTGGLNFNCFFNKRIGLVTGVLFSNKGYQSKSHEFIAIDPLIDDPSIPNSAKFVYNHYYIDVPLKALFSAGKRKVRFIASLGIVTNILIKSTFKNVLEFQGGTEKTTRSSTIPYKKINFSPTISVGLEKRFKNKSVIRLEPTFNYGLVNIIDTPVATKLWSAGLNISYYLRLK